MRRQTGRLFTCPDIGQGFLRDKTIASGARERTGSFVPCLEPPRTRQLGIDSAPGAGQDGEERRAGQLARVSLRDRLLTPKPGHLAQDRVCSFPL